MNTAAPYIIEAARVAPHLPALGDVRRALGYAAVRFAETLGLFVDQADNVVDRIARARQHEHEVHLERLFVRYGRRFT